MPVIGQPPKFLGTKLSSRISDAIGNYYRDNPSQSDWEAVRGVLEALEIIRYNVTEAWLSSEKTSVPKW